MLAEEWLDTTKRKLAQSIRGYGVRHSMTQKDMAYLLETTQPRVSHLYHEKIENFSLDQLLKWSYNLGINVTITVV